MKGRKLTLILVMLLVVVCIFALAGCHTHTCDETVWNSDNAGHWHDATCKHTGEKIDYAAHTLFKVEAKEPTCTEEGNNQYYYCGTCNAAFKDEAMTKPTYDYAEVIPAKAHVYNQKVTNASTLVSAATCTSKAVYYFSCECGAIGEETFEAGEFASHSLQLIPAVEATCEHSGNNAYYTCTVCNQYFKDEAATKYTSPEAEVLPITAHTAVHHAGVPATCTAEGTSEYWTCSVCEKMFEDAYCNSEITSVRTVPMTAHNYTQNPADKYKATEATCLVAATYYESCSECGLQGKETFSFGGFGSHVLSEIAAKAPTCTAAGSQRYYQCTVCTKYFADLAATTETTPEEMVVPATEHKYDQKVVDNKYKVTEATCTTQATYYYSCVCGLMSSSEVFSGGAYAQHIPGEVVEAVAPVCYADGTLVDGNIAYSICYVCSQPFHVNDEGKVETLTAEQIVDKAAHDYQQIVSPAALYSMATCAEYAQYYESCAVCGYVCKDTTVRPLFKTGTTLPHTYETDEEGNAILTPAVEATCTENGNVAYYKCTVCSNYVDENGKILGASLSHTEIESFGSHNYVATYNSDPAYVYSPATCYAPLILYMSCSRCGQIHDGLDKDGNPYSSYESYTFEYGDPLPHNFAKDEAGNAVLTPAVEATCDTNGSIAYYYCQACGKFVDESGVAHDDPVVAKLGHNFTAEIVDDKYLASEATCTAKATYYHACVNCDMAGTTTFTSGEFAPHDFSAGLTPAVPATCDAEGSIAYYRCEICKGYFNENQAYVGNDIADTKTMKLGHEYTEQTNKHLATEATCTKKATYYYECVRCGAADPARTYESGDFLPHDFDIDNDGKDDLAPAVAADCENGGNIAYYHCEACGQYFNESKAVVGKDIESTKTTMLGHEYTEQTNKYLATGATCTKKATYYYECVRCGAADPVRTYETGDFLPHDFDLDNDGEDDLTPAVAADCENGGNIAYYCCEACGQYFNESKAVVGKDIESTKTAALGHEFTDDTKRDAEHLRASATCDLAETYYYHCSRCDVNAKDVDQTKFYEVGEKLPHTVETWIAAITADCIEDGAKAHYLCSACNKYIDADKTTIIGEKYEDIVIKATGHDFTKQDTADAFLKDPATCATKAVYYVSCQNCREIDTTQTFESGELLTTHTGPIVLVPAVDEFSVDSFPAVCNYEHYVCECCEAVFADANGNTPFTQNNGNPYYKLDRPTMAMGTMVGGKFDMNVTTTLTQATSDSYTINGLVPYIKGDNWGVEGLVDGNRVAIQFAAKLLKYASGQTGVIARIFSTNGYFKEYTVADLQAGSTENNIEAGSFLAMFNVGKNSTVTLQILTGENIWTDYVFKLATEVTLVEFVEETQPTYWWDGNYDYFQYTVTVEGVANTYRFKDGYCKEPIVDFSAYVIPKLPVEVLFGSLVDGAFVAAGNDSTATFTDLSKELEMASGESAYLIDGAILTNANGVAKFAIKLNAKFATYFEHNADSEIVLKITRMSNEATESYKLPHFKFAEDGTLVWEFKVVAGEVYRIALRDYERTDNWLYYYFVIDDGVVTPTKVEAAEASYWTEGRKEHYTLTDATTGEVTYYEDVYCTKQTTKEEVISAQFEITLTTEADVTYKLERLEVGKYAVKGIVLYNGLTHNFGVRFDTKFIEEYTNANYDTTKVIIKIKSGATEINYTLQDVLNIIESFYVQDETTGEMVLSEAPYILFEGDAALLDAQFIFSFVNPANASDWMDYKISMDQNLYCPKLMPTIAPTYFTVGTKEHYKCLRTNKMFADETCTTEYTDEADLLIEKVMPELQSGSYDFDNNAFTAGGVYYLAELDEQNVYIVNGTILKTSPMPNSTSEYKFVLRFNDNFAKWYEDLADDEVVLKVKLAPGATANHNNPAYEGYNIFTKASAFEADGSIVFISDSFRTDVMEVCLWNTTSNSWETYSIKISDTIARVEFLAEAQIGTIVDNIFKVGEFFNINKDAFETLKCNVTINELGVYVISGIVPSLQDKEGMDTQEYQFTLRFNYQFKEVYANTSDNTVIVKYLLPDGTVYASYTKAQLATFFANDSSLFFSGDALQQGALKCQIMTADGDGTQVWLEYQIKVADDVVCPYFMHERAADYWNRGYAKHYINNRMPGKYFKDYACTEEINPDEEAFFVEKLVFDGMEAGAYVADTVNGGYKFSTYDHIEYAIGNETGAWLVSGRVSCCLNQEDATLKGQNAFVIKIKGNFYKYFFNNEQKRDGSCVVIKLTVTAANGTVTTREYTRDEIRFDTDGSMIFSYKAIPGATIRLDVLDPMSSLTGKDANADFSLLSYEICVASDVKWTHNAKYNVVEEATYWTEGRREAVCTDCGSNTNLTPEDAKIAKLMPTVQNVTDNAAVEYNEVDSAFEVLTSATTVKIKVVGTFLNYYASFADDDVVATVKDSNGNVIATITKADLMADGFEFEIANATAGMTFKVELVNPDGSADSAVYSFVVKENA